MLLTVLTPTFNRGDLIDNVYKCLLEQTNQNFEWLIIDDGSTDNTEEVIQKMIDEEKINIRYIFKENGGKHTALNVGFKELRGELTVILDSDDVLKQNAVETVATYWEKFKDNQNLCGMAFLSCYPNNNIIGDLFPKNEWISNHVECITNLNIKGDKCEVYRSSVFSKFEFPEFKGEKFVAEGLIWVQIGKEYNTLYINKALLIKEYHIGGLTNSGRKMRLRNPKGGMAMHQLYLDKQFKLQVRVKNMLLFICYGFFDGLSIEKMKKMISSKKIFLLCLPAAFSLYKLWNRKYMLEQ
jgi:glycosyltransferase involved in cell wall biosynthesis